jgi:hypothetical protein
MDGWIDGWMIEDRLMVDNGCMPWMSLGVEN